MLLAGLAGAVAIAGVARAADGDVGEFPIDTEFGGFDAITTGADGNLWLAVNGGIGNHIGRLTTEGEYTEFETQSPGIQRMIATPDGAIWVTQWGGASSAVARITPSTGGTAIRYDRIELDGEAQPRGITVGPDGAIWFTEWNLMRLGRVDPETLALTEFDVPLAGRGPDAIVTWNDELWLTATSTQNQLLRVALDGTVLDQIDLDVWPSDLAVGGDDLYIAGSSFNSVLRRTAGRETRTYPVERGALRLAIDGRGFVWFTDGNILGTGATGRLDPSTGAVDHYTVPSVEGTPSLAITIGPDGAVWTPESQFSQHPEGSNVIARFETGVEVVPESESDDGDEISNPALDGVSDLGDALTGKNIAQSGGLAFVLLVFVMLPSTLINQTLERRYLAPSNRRFGIGRAPFWRSPRGIVLFALLVMVLQMLQAWLADLRLDAHVGFWRAALAGIVTFGSGALVTSAVILAVEWFALRRIADVDDPELTARPAALFVTVAAIVVSVLLTFQPVLTFGVLLGYAAARRLRNELRARTLFVAGIGVFVVAIAAWAGADGLVPRTLPHGMLLGVFVAGIDWLFIGLLPLPRLPGFVLFRWNRVAALSLWFLGVFVLILGVVTPGVNGVHAATAWLAGLVLGALNAGAFWFWLAGLRRRNSETTQPVSAHANSDQANSDQANSDQASVLDLDATDQRATQYR
jgi:virginiamycin B lyase